MILQLLTDNWKEFADRFIPQGKESVSYIQKHKEECFMLDMDKVLEYERKLNMIRNCIMYDTLQRNHKDCTPEEVAQSKYNRLMSLIERRPELKPILESKL